MFDLSGEYRSNVFALIPKDGIHRLVVDVVGYVAGEKASSRSLHLMKQQNPWLRSAIPVAIDLTAVKIRCIVVWGVEKRVALQIAKRLARRFQSEPASRRPDRDNDHIQLKDHNE